MLCALPGIYRDTESVKEALPKKRKWFVVMCFVLPQLIGLIIAAADHSHPFILIDQSGCFASFVSGYRAYTELVDVPWIVKVSTVIGLNN